jgi:hypothetical protein
MPDHVPDHVPDLSVERVADLGVKPARVREGVSSAGGGGVSRVVHLVPQAAEVEGSEDVHACCGAWFAPGTWEDVAWGELWPHAVCVERSPVRRSVLERAFQAAETQSTGSDDEWKSSFRAAEKIVSLREDWGGAIDSEDWVYGASFNGALAGESRFPRSVDIGLAPLSVELVCPRVFRIHSCGVREGCVKHGVHSETYSLDDVTAIKERLTLQEQRALSIDLQELAWCLIFGACSKKTLTLILR